MRGVRIVVLGAGFSRKRFSRAVLILQLLDDAGAGFSLTRLGSRAVLILQLLDDAGGGFEPANR